MSQLPENVWTFAVTLYAKDGVADDCLLAQDHYGLDVPALLFALYRAARKEGFNACDVQETVRDHANRIVEPLRKARQGLKLVSWRIDAQAGETLRDKVKAAELEAEQLVLLGLNSIDINIPPLSFYDSLVAIADAAQVPLDERLKALLKRLAQAAQSM